MSDQKGLWLNLSEEDLEFIRQELHHAQTLQIITVYGGGKPIRVTDDIPVTPPTLHRPPQS